MKVVIDSLAWVSKAELTPANLESLRTALTITPRKVGDHPGEDPSPIRLYSENAGSFGMPRQYFLGRRKSGHDVEFRTTEGDKSSWPGNLKFSGSLRPEQERALLQMAQLFRGGSLGGLARAVPGWGKCLKVGTKVMLHSGELVNVEDVCVGDSLMGPDSKARKVLSTTRSTGQLYRVIPTIGEPWVCNDAHILTLVNNRTDQLIDVPIKEWMTWTPSVKHYHKQLAPPEGVDFPDSQPLPLDPYFLGVWYGDGTKSLKNVAITKDDPEIAALCNTIAASFGLHVREERTVHLEHPCTTRFITSGEKGRHNPLLDLLRVIATDLERFPAQYLRASRADRLQFLAGLLDTDGYHNNGCYEIVQKRQQWSEDIAFLARSLGIRATVKQKVVNGTTYWRVKLAGDFFQVPMRIERKKPRERKQIKVATRTGFTVEDAGVGEYAGFTLEGDGRFLLGNFTITHNTVFSCALIAEMRVPVLVVVHKEFLMDQWKQRIEAFLPGAQIGIAQGPKADFKGKHVVMGMVHSLAAHDYGPDFYNYFGMTIVDECHRIGSATWSQVPAKFPARWRLGLSATPRRLDGCDNVFYYHIGPLIFTSKEVRMKPKIRYVHITPTEFHLVHTPNFNPNLIKKALLLRFMCKSPRRNQVIINQIILALKAGRKCLVVSERLQHLQDLETMLYASWKAEDGSKPSVGFYIGGQEQEALDEAAKARCIFATNQLVQEGLDIPPLDTLFMTTPLSNIEQVCVPPGSMLWAGSQPKVVESIECGDHLIAGGAEIEGKVTKCWTNEYSGPLVTIRGMYLEPMRLTPNHPVTVRAYRRARVDGSRNKTKVLGPVQDIPAGDLLGCTDARLLSRGFMVGLPIWKTEQAVADINDNRAELLGYYIAEGNIRNYTRVNKRTPQEILRNKRVKMGKAVQFSFGSHELHLANRVAELAKIEFKANATVRVRYSVASVVVYSVEFTDFVGKHVKGLANSKKLSSELMSLPLTCQQVLVKAAHIGDGCITIHSVRKNSSTHYWRYATASRVLALQMQMLLLRQGHIASLLYKPPSTNRFSDKCSWEVTYALGTRTSGVIEDGVLWANIVSINQDHYEGSVLNFSVSPQEHYALTGGLVHNCGRILRPHEGKKEPVVVDFRDDHINLCKRASSYREKFYSKKD